MKKISLVMICSLLACSLNSFSKDPITSRDLARSNAAFAVDLYAKLASQDGNLFFSPYSISIALGMTYMGAEGQTALQMAGAMHFPENKSAFAEAFHSLQENVNRIQQYENVELNAANSLWIQDDYRIVPDYMGVVRSAFLAEVFNVNFKTDFEGTRQKINLWVEQQTKDKIKQLLAPGVLNAMTRMVLVNAIYFNGTWQYPFDEQQTAEAEFWTTPEDPIHAQFMTQKNDFRYMEDEKIQLLEMPYRGRSLSMVVLLPKDVVGLEDVEKMLTYDYLNTCMEKLSLREVIVHLPKFKTESQFGLSSTLKQLGMSDAFEPGKADFSGITGTLDLFISAVIHKAVVDVNEKGTEAAAATAVVMECTAMPMEPYQPPEIFRADHPFIFLIKENQTWSILFMGRIEEVTSDQ